MKESLRKASPDLIQDEAPPPYEDEHVDITAAFSNLNLSQDLKFPSKDQCIAHLKLLEAIYLLKEDVVSRDGLYGIHDAFVPDYATDQETTKILERIREKRWQVFVCKAVQRFQVWFKNKFQPDGRMCTIDDMEKASYGLITKLARPLQPPANKLPPLDVLMVWHSYILNPRNYLSDCIRFGSIDLWAGGMPWQAISSVIQNDTLAYEPNDDAKSQWTALTGSPWDPLQDTTTITIACPKCDKQHTKAWTTYTKPEHFIATLSLTDFQGDGYADPGFKVACNCGLLINHDLLRCYKFMTDLKNLMAHNIPMPGSSLNTQGRPTPCTESGLEFGDITTLEMIFPSRILRDGGLASAFGDPKDPSVTTPSAIRSVFEEIMKTKLRQIITIMDPLRRNLRLTQGERTSIRKMMACYWENSSIFSMDLVGAVLRQGVFIEKMHDIDWLHSPALHSTMERLLLKYSRFFDIMGKYPKQVAVPTLDVDLAWHTHQLSPKSYYDYSTKITNNVFIDHDDKIAESKLNTAFEWTSRTYQALFKSVYSECTCWYCESTREISAPHGLKRIFDSSAKAVNLELEELHQTSRNSTKAPHISTHNAINANDHVTLRNEERLNKYRLEASYQRVVARAKKQGRIPPPRRDIYSSPYMAYPFWAASYIVPPACGSFTAGAVGNCAAGTCGGTVSMGGCAGAIGSCAGISTGGCAGASGFVSVGDAFGGAACGGGGGGGSFGGCGGSSGGGGCGGGGGGCGGGG